LKIFAEIRFAHDTLPASKLGKKASTNLGAIQGSNDPFQHPNSDSVHLSTVLNEAAQNIHVFRSWIGASQRGTGRETRRLASFGRFVTARSISKSRTLHKIGRACR
ncbi:hypothetical protein ACFVTJ_25245, partial [Agrobacterium sp. NPDC058088]|uniref:hypothetical protein n=1 Tax=Agrobacterium sp. NPDC058088 TaxID=3346335 RepID=UPI0036DED8D9